MTATALDRLGVRYDYFEPDQFASVDLSTYRVIIFGEDAPHAPLNAHPDKARAWIEGGGKLLLLRDVSSPEEWLPEPLTLRKDTSSYGSPKILDPAHPVFNRPNSLAQSRFRFYDPPPNMLLTCLSEIHNGTTYAAYGQPGPAWKPLLEGGQDLGWQPAKFSGPHYGLLEGQLGKGRILACQMVPVLSMIEDKSRTGARFVQNMVEWAGVATRLAEP
jgi:hypothetical protein